MLICLLSTKHQKTWIYEAFTLCGNSIRSRFIQKELKKGLGHGNV